MLAIISDLHFCDGTATPGNVAPAVFALALREIHEIAAKVAHVRGKPTRVDLVFLGDIFDLLRTERWIEDAQGAPVPLDERPWGSAAAVYGEGVTPKVAARARGILDGILATNAETLATLRGEREAPPDGVEVRRIYIPGNHDRLYLHDAGIRAGILASLGAVGGEALASEGGHVHSLEMPEYATVARHGHEWDAFNFPGFTRGAAPESYTNADYLPTPIGDAVTAELAVRLPHEVRARLLATAAFPDDLAHRVHRKLMRIEDVRPLFASFHWAHYAVRCLATELDQEHAHILEAVLSDSLRDLARSFRALDFYRAWDEHHHTPFCIDAALLVRLALAALSAPSCFPVEWIAKQVERVLATRSPLTVTRRGALHEDLATVASKEMRFVVYGHTHGPEVVPLHGGTEARDVYVNTGTYRPGLFRADDGEGFVGWQRLAYVCIANPDEAVCEETPFGPQQRGPAFVAWAGARSLGAMSRAGMKPIR